MAREGRAVCSLVLVDAALSRHLTNMKELCQVRDSCPSWPGIAELRKTLRLAHKGSESPYESVARYQLLTSRVLAVPQVWAFDSTGPVGCGDLWLPHYWAFLEIDGDIKYAEGVNTLMDEKRLQERLEDAGFGVARVSARRAGDRELILRLVRRARDRGRLARATCPASDGYVGPPPRWARRGTLIAYARPLVTPPK